MGSRHRVHSAAEVAWLGQRVRAARLKAGLTQEEAGVVFGRDQSFIAKIERGERQLTALELRDLCRLFNVPVSDVLAEESTGRE